MVSNGLSSETATFRQRLRISCRSASEAERELALVMVDLSCLIIEEASVMMRELGLFVFGKKRFSDRRLKTLGMMFHKRL
jgi:hypothetical protein